MEKKGPSIWHKLFHISIVALFVSLLAILAIRLAVSELKKEEIPLKLGKNPLNFKNRSRQGTYMLLKNLNFRLTDEIDLKVYHLIGEAIPKKPYALVNFDDVNQFVIDILEADVFLETRILEHIFNNIVFNYAGSPLKNLKMKFIQVDGQKERRLLLSGDMKLVMWIGFEMTGKMTLDKDNVLFVIEAEKIKSLGNPMTKTLLDIVGLNLEKLLPVPSGRGITMKGNQIIVEPFTIFPPPQIGGYISEMELLENGIRLKFDNEFKVKFPDLPEPKVKNYLFLYQGDVKFGKLRMVDTRLQMIDLDPKDDFDFYLKKYFVPLVKGYSKIKSDASVVAYIPDFNDAIRP